MLVPVFLFAWPLHAQETQPAAWSAHRSAADWISSGLVVGQLGAATWYAGTSDDRGHQLGCLALRAGVTIGSAEVTKRLVHRTRPDASDRKSFYSEHTALATVASGWRFQIGIPIAIGTGYLRMAADKHFASDVAVGAFAGLLTRKLCS